MSETAPCVWCGEPSVTGVVVIPGRKLKRVRPVCETHASRFERQGQMTTRLEVDKRMEAERKRNDWKKRQS